MRAKVKYIFLATFAGLILLARPAFSQDTPFHTIQLGHGITLDVPPHWTVLSMDTRQNIRAAGDALTDNAGIEGPNSRKESLLAINSTPSPSGAMIRVNVTFPPDYTQSDLAAATPADLKEFGAEIFAMSKQLEAAGSIKIIEMQPLRIERINNHRALAIPYIRTEINGPYLWQVTQYKIPASDRFIEITLSHRQSDAALWRPILERVKRSVRF